MFTPQTLLLFVLILLGMAMVMGMWQRKELSLEERVADTLSAIEGVGDVRVVIATKPVRTQTSMQIVNGQQMEIPCGAVAVAKGADDPWIQGQIIDALCALLGLPVSAVSVISGGE